MLGMNEREIFANIQENINYLLKIGGTDNSSDLWSTRAGKNLKKYVSSDGRINEDEIRNFRRHGVFIVEMPNRNLPLPVWYLSGSHRGQRKYLSDRAKVMKKKGDLELLEKFPISPIGNPYWVEYQGCKFNKRWSNNIRYLSLSKKHLDAVLKKDSATVLDIGGGYGLYPSLLKHEYPKLRGGVVEFPEQLLLTYYYISSTFKDIRINTIRDAYEADRIDDAFFAKYDFLLVPIECFSKVDINFDLVSNFYSLGEMSDEWFATYRNSNVLAKAKYLFTINRFESRPSYDTDINILSYRLQEYDQMFFGISPYERYYPKVKCLFFHEKEFYSSQFFEFIGKKK